jgi:SAM-dependent methyltransferase
MSGAEFYSSLGKQYEDAFAENAGLLSFIRSTLKYLPIRAKILDVGCGTGKPVAVELAASGHYVTGFDISETMIELSRNAVPDGNFSIADMQHYVPPEGMRFEAVFNILSLFLQDRKGLETMAGKWATWLDSGGLLCICTMAADDLIPESRGSKYDSDGLCAQNMTNRFMGTLVKITGFTKEGWRILLDDCGFEILETKVEWFRPPKEANTDDEPHYYIIARKK